MTLCICINTVFRQFITVFYKAVLYLSPSDYSGPQYVYHAVIYTQNGRLYTYARIITHKHGIYPAV